MKRQDECRAWLESYRELRTEANRLWRRHERLRAQATQITAKFKDTPGGSGGDPENVLAALADADTEALAMEEKAVTRMLEIERFIDALSNPITRHILQHRYIELLRWPALVEALRKDGIYYEDRHVFRLHGIALKEAREAWNKREETNNA